MNRNKIIFIFFLLNILFFISCEEKKTVNKVLFFGDSITKLGEKKNGFITIIDSLIKVNGLQNHLITSTSGVIGDKVTDLYLRCEQDVINKSPKYVVIFIGINDIWKKPCGSGTDSRTFVKFFEALTNKLSNNSCKIIVCTPTVIGENMDSTNKYNTELDAYSKWFESHTKYYNLYLINLHKPFVDFELKNNKGNKQFGLLTIDGIHFSDAGNKLVALEMWKVIKNL